jgi:hypothetical protein
MKLLIAAVTPERAGILVGGPALALVLVGGFHAAHDRAVRRGRAVPLDLRIHSGRTFNAVDCALLA